MKERSKTSTRTTDKKVPAPPQPLSPKEKGVLEFLEFYMHAQGVSPTYQEICQHFGFASFNSVQRYLKQLESKGYIRLPWSNQKRAITLLRPSSAVQDAIEEWHSEDASARSAAKPTANVAAFSKTTAEKSTMTPAIFSAESLSLPLLGRVAAGAPIEALDHDEFIDVPASLVRHADRTFALRVQGQSMIDDGILDGDVILVQRQGTANNGEIVVAVIDEEATVKRFYMHRDKSVEDKRLELRPANSNMAPMWFDPREVQIRGVVVGLIRRF